MKKVANRPLTDGRSLNAAGLIAADQKDAVDAVASHFAIAVPSALLRHRSPGLSRQFVPDPRELDTQPYELDDPIADRAHTPVHGIVHRYRNRLLLKIVQVCPVYCRFCFRREMIGPGETAMLSDRQREIALAYIASHPQIEEVIMTGGDPLVLSPRRIRELTRHLEAFPHLKRLRWHSRVPVMNPERITDKLADALTDTALEVRIAIHAKHPAEFTSEAKAAVHRLQRSGASLLSQSVLLANINDDAETLYQLYAGFIEHGITPYYLHHLDLAKGTSHFRVPIRRGRQLMHDLEQQLPAGSAPAYMLDSPGGFGKIDLLGRAVRLLGSDSQADLYRVRDPDGAWHIYRDYNGAAGQRRLPALEKPQPQLTLIGRETDHQPAG